MTAPTQSEVRAVVDEVLEPLGAHACSDGSCVFGPPGGMHTNGGCRCLKNAAHTSRAILPAFVQLATAIRIMATEVARRRKDC